MQCKAHPNGEQCNSEATSVLWQRWATPAEVDQYHESGDLPPSESTARLLMQSCEAHDIDLDLKAGIHPSDCEWESTGTCQHEDADLTYEGIPVDPHTLQSLPQQ